MLQIQTKYLYVRTHFMFDVSALEFVHPTHVYSNVEDGRNMNGLISVKSALQSKMGWSSYVNTHTHTNAHAYVRILLQTFMFRIEMGPEKW